MLCVLGVSAVKRGHSARRMAQRAECKEQEEAGSEQFTGELSMDLSIIIPTRNRPEDLAKMLQSLSSAEKADMAFEVLVVDNNSQEALAKQNRDIVNRAELPVRYVEERIPGKSAALNSGVNLARGEMIAFLDDDVVIHRDYFQGVKKSLNLTADVLGGRVFATWPHTPPKWISRSGHLRNSWGPIVAHDYGDRPMAYNDAMRLPIGCNVLCKRELFERYGRFDVRLGPGASPGILGGEETDLLKRFRAAGARLIYTPWIAVDHPVTSERMTKKYFRFRYFCAGRSIPYTTKKEFPSIVGIPRYLFRELAVSSVKSATALVSRQPVAAFDHKLHACMVLGSIYEYARRKFQFQSTSSGSILKTLSSTRFIDRQIAK
jgi:glycosyltransferase involved in cell wall biosynthesis